MKKVDKKNKAANLFCQLKKRERKRRERRNTVVPVEESPTLYDDTTATAENIESEPVSLPDSRNL